MEKYGDTEAQQCAELEEVRQQLRTLRAFKESLHLALDAPRQIAQLEARERALVASINERPSPTQ
jgi:hypothetical protein